MKKKLGLQVEGQVELVAYGHVESGGPLLTLVSWKPPLPGP